VHEKRCVLGKVEGDKIVLNDVGKSVERWWLNIEDHFENVELDTYVIMPNHFHGIIIIVGAGYPRPRNDVTFNTGRGDRAPTLGNIVAYFKYGSTKQINLLRNDPGTRFWQRNYYEHVIRSEEDLSKTREYILSNPVNWLQDEYFE